MTVYPAIDLKDGKAVRLTRGLMDSAKIYSDEPWQLAKYFESCGAEWLHIVDLNGAFAGEPKNLEQIKKIREHCDLKIQLGGGVRDEQTIGNYCNTVGIDRIILGSIAAREPEFVKTMAAKYPIAVGIDAKEGYVAVEGWAEVGSMKAAELAENFSAANVEAIICTDISRDGMLSGVNIGFTESIAKASRITTIASGGVKDIGDIEAAVENAWVGGVIVGKAYYEGKLDIKLAISLARKKITK